MRGIALLQQGLLLLLLAMSANCQSYFYDARHLEPRIRLEIGLQAGLMNALTDLGGKPGPAKRFLGDMNREASHLSEGVFIQAAVASAISLRLQWASGTVSGADSLCTGTDRYSRLRYQRNLHFRSRIRETALLLQVEPLNFRSGSGPQFFLSPYLLMGVGIFHFNPEAWSGKEWVALPPLATEGRKYLLTQWNLPFGAGIRMAFSARSFLGVEFLYRKLFTDYLDDVSTAYVQSELVPGNTSNSYWTVFFSDRRRNNPNGNTTDLFSTKRGNPGAKDSYCTFMLHAGWVLNRRKR